MDNILNESDFLTVNLRSITNRKTNKQVEDETAATSENKQTVGNYGERLTKDTSWVDCGKELERRLNANRNMSREAKLSAYDIKTEFFKEFFTAKWPDKTCANKLIQIGGQLQKAIEVLEFDPKINPILAFILIPYVQNELIKPGLLNINTFSAIYWAVANHKIADSEFIGKERSYNLIYCRDLYKKSPSDMQKYIEVQANILDVSASSYSKDLRNKNISIFISTTEKVKVSSKITDKKTGEASQYSASTTEFKPSPMTSPKAVLKALDDLKIKSNSSDSSDNKKVADKNVLIKLAAQIKTPAEAYAVLQFLSLSANSTIAKQGLTSDKLSKVTTKDVTAATAKVSGIVSKLNFSKQDIDQFVNILLAKL